MGPKSSIQARQACHVTLAQPSEQSSCRKIGLLENWALQDSVQGREKRVSARITHFTFMFTPGVQCQPPRAIYQSYAIQRTSGVVSPCCEPGTGVGRGEPIEIQEDHRCAKDWSKIQISHGTTGQAQLRNILVLVIGYPGLV